MTAPGWYPDPEDLTKDRWWDGNQWTDQKRDKGLGSTVPPHPQSAPNVQPQAHYGARVNTWLWQSIVVTVLCCLPFGIAGIVFASSANSHLQNGDIVKARQSADKARLFTLIGLFSVPVVFGLFFVMGMAEL